MREIVSLSDDWRFVAKEVTLEEAKAEPGEKISIPHTWNAIDGQDGGGDYVRARYWYFRKFDAPSLVNGQRLYIEFNGVNSSCEVFLNGKSLGVHHGGYSRFRFDLTDALLQGENELAVSVDNRPNEKVYPQTADFTFYGGIYRDVNLIKVEKEHFELDHFGCGGIKIDSIIEGFQAELIVSAWTSLPKDTRVRVLNKDGEVVAEGKGNEKIIVPDVVFWQGVSNPYLYRVIASAYVDGEKVDEVEEEYGFRLFKVHPKKGFILNGVEYPLCGVARHQDRLGVGNAISRENMEEDAKLIKEIGASTVRLAHYQHDDYFYTLCDRYGFLVWSEIPYISRHMKEGHENNISQMTELIVQTYNHPSIIVRGISNEITMKPSTGKTKAHKELNDLIHKMDPSRLTAMANFAMMLAFNPFCHIADVTSMNFYHGWYTPWTWLNGLRLSFFHFFFPKKPLGFSEYGAEGMPNLHSAKPKRGDNTEEYQLLFHYKVYSQLEKRPWLWATHLWNMFDFAADARNVGGDPGKNHKGLVTFDRKIKKDAFYLYKAFWSSEPFIHLCGKRFVDHHEKVATIYVCTNLNSVTLYVNGEEFKTLDGFRRLYRFDVPMTDKVHIVAKAGECIDSMDIRKVAKKNPDYILQVKSNNQSWEKKK